MFEWMPVVRGSYLTYSEYFGVTFALVALGVGLLCLVISFLIAKCFGHAKKYQHVHRASYYETIVDTPEDDRVSMTMSMASSTRSSGSRKKKSQKLSVYFDSYFNWVGWSFISIVGVCLSLFDTLFNPFFGSLLMFGILGYRVTSRYYAENNRRLNHEHIRESMDSSTYFEELSSLRFKHKASLFGLLVISFVFGFSFTGGCLDLYEDSVGVTLFGGMSISTTLIRYFQLKDACPLGAPCQIYATLPEDASTSVFINAHTNDAIENIEVSFAPKGTSHTLRRVQTSNIIKLSSFEQRGRRNVHTVLLTELQPETRYVMNIEYNQKIQTTFEYVTLPDKSSNKDLVISTGGDIGDRKIARDMIDNALTNNPDVIVVGGDIVYDDAERSCYFAWDSLLKTFTTSMLSHGKLIPLIFSVGNHDVGLNSMPSRNITLTTEKSPIFMMYFPQHTVENSKAPALEQRRTYHYHTIGKTVQVHLDSGYLFTFKDQVPFINEVATKYNDYIKMANYHNPIYWVCSVPRGNIVELTKEYWMPLFDKYRFMSAFENHEHALKKTFTITDNKVSKTGTYYLGNGKWGVSLSSTCHPNNSTGLIEHMGEDNHYWSVVVSVREGTVSYAPINSKGETIIPAFKQNINDYLF